MNHGVHHVTAICGDPRRNVAFYSGALGLRLVKKTVNFDDPQTYHLYYGDDVGHPGSLLTFFPWPGAERGRVGPGQIAVTSFGVAPSALGFWIERLLRHGVAYRGPTPRRVGDVTEQVLAFEDADGLMLEIVATARANGRPGRGDVNGIPGESSIRGVCGVTMWEEDGAPTAELLVDLLGFESVGTEETTERFVEKATGSVVGVRTIGGFPRGNISVGTVHHVAWRVRDDAEQLALRGKVIDTRLAPTPVIDRRYFRSVYFNEPGGVLFELATDGPGFLIDESADHLGEQLQLPPQYEPSRKEIEAALPEML